MILTFAPLKVAPPPVLSYREALVAWNPGTDLVRVGPLMDGPDAPDWTDHPIRYECTAGAAYRIVRQMTGDKLIARMLTDWHDIVVRDRCDVVAAHKAFLGVSEYRKLFA
jgi:hypothetical protein